MLDTDGWLINQHWTKDWVPAVNISENEKNYEIDVAVPGMRKSDLKISVNHGVLTVSAEHQEEKEEKKKNYTRQEYNYSSFKRSFTLPDDAKAEDVKAHYEDGVLKLTVAKKASSAPSKAKEITIA